MLFAEKVNTLSTENFIYTLFETVKIPEDKIVVFTLVNLLLYRSPNIFINCYQQSVD